MKAIARITALEKASSKNKTHYISNADCAVVSNWQGCAAQTCRNGCWFTEDEYTKRIAETKHLNSQWLD